MCRELAKIMYIRCKNYPFKSYNVTGTLGVLFHAQVGGDIILVGMGESEADEYLNDD